jgi:hypothetical protein
MASIKVIRKKQGLLGAIRKFKIYVDDKKIGELAFGKEQEYELPAGKHKIYCIQDMFNTPYVYEFELNENDSKVFIASYIKSNKIMAVLIGGFIISSVGSQLLTELLGLNPRIWICFYTLFVMLIILVMKKLKMFQINIAEI